MAAADDGVTADEGAAVCIGVEAGAEVAGVGAPGASRFAVNPFAGAVAVAGWTPKSGSDFNTEL